MNRYLFSFMVSRLKIGDVWVLFNWLNTENVFIEDPDHPIYQLLESGSRIILPVAVNGEYDDFQYLVDHHFLVQDQETIRDAVREQYHHVMDPAHLSVILMPVDQACNFRCPYCYEDHGKCRFMDDQDLEIFYRYVASQRISTLRVDYFGGEPLLNLSFIRKCNSTMIELGKKQGFTVTPSSMTTNGYLLTKSVFLELHDLHITSYQITVDRDRENHDKMRPLANGEGTYDVVYQNLLDMASTDKKFSLTLRSNFTPLTGSSEKRREFLEKVYRDFGKDKRFILMPEPVSKWKPGEAHNPLMHCSKQLASKLRSEFQAEAEAMGMETLSMVLLCGPESHFCYAAKPSNLIIYPKDKDGRLPTQKCTLEVSAGSNNVGYISPDGELIRNENWDKWVSDNLFAARKCQNCFFVLNCFGNACSHKNQAKGRIICPKEKKQEHDLVRRVLGYISRNQDFAEGR